MMQAIILAAGKGTRMKSDLAKVLHPVRGIPMLSYSIAVARSAGAGRIVVVIGHQADVIRGTFRDPDLVFVEQRTQLGTGHAVLQTRDVFRGYEGRILILCGDVPCLKAETVRALVDRHDRSRASVTVLTVFLADPGSYGRIVHGPDGSVRRIVEAKDATPREREIREINTGIYCVEAPFLFTAVEEIGNDNVQGEYYLTDMVELAVASGRRVASFPAENPDEVMGVNTREDLERACRFLGMP